MNLFRRYLKQQWRLLAVEAVFCSIFFVSFWLYHLPLEAVLYPVLLCSIIGVSFFLADFVRIKRKHNILTHIEGMTEVKESIWPKAENLIEWDYQEILRLLAEEHNEYCTQANQKYEEMIEYYTVWAHQIKTPIASMRLHLQNEDSALSRKLFADLHRIEQYVEMVLTFLRLNSESSDYVIREYDLDTIVRSAVRKFSHEFIERKLNLAYEPLQTAVITDEKWLSFVLEQVLSNALKYTRTGSITISVDENKKLSVRDTGIGIAPEDLPRIFENGYTGFNGRADKKASGLGLYLCRRICSRLGHGISAESVVDKGTIITIDLAQNKLEVE